MAKKTEDTNNQIVLGQSRFWIDYRSKKFLPMDKSGQAIDYRDLKPIRSDRMVIQGRAPGYPFLPVPGWEHRFNKFKINIPAEVLEKPFHQKPDFIAAVNRYCSRSNFRLIDEDTRRRLDEGVLPKVRVGDSMWLADGYNECFINADEPKLKLVLPFTPVDAEDGKYMLQIFDKLEGFRDDLTPDYMTKFPENAMPIRLLKMEYLDPVGRALRERRLPTGNLVLTPFQANHTAEILSWKKVGWLEEVNNNRRLIGLPMIKEERMKNNDIPSKKKEMIEEKKKPSAKRKRGLGM